MMKSLILPSICLFALEATNHYYVSSFTAHPNPWTSFASVGQRTLSLGMAGEESGGSKETDETDAGTAVKAAADVAGTLFGVAFELSKAAVGIAQAGIQAASSKSESSDTGKKASSLFDGISFKLPQRKSRVDVSIPYDAAARFAYEEWKQKYPNKVDYLTDDSFEKFEANYNLVTVRNVISKKMERERETGDAEPQEDADDDGEEGTKSLPPIRFYELNELADELSPEEYAKMLDQTLVDKLFDSAFGFLGSLAEATLGTLNVEEETQKLSINRKTASKKGAPNYTTSKKQQQPLIPTLSRWKQNEDGSITGNIRNSRNFRNGQKITTSPVRRGAKAGTFVTTRSGSKYKLM